MAVKETLELDLTAALRGVDQVGAALTQVTGQFKVGLADALDQLRGVEVTADVSEIPPAVEGAVDAAEKVAEVTADASEIPPAVEGAVDAAEKVAEVEADASEIPPAVESAVDGAEKVAEIEADASQIVPAIEGAVDAAPKTAVIDVDVTGIDEAVAGIGEITDESGDASVAAAGIGASLSRVITPGRLATAGVALLSAAVIKTGIDYNALEQRSRAAFTTILGSADAATQMMEDLMAFARTSPFPRQAFIDATQQLLAFGFEAREVIPILETIEDTVAAIGGGEAELALIVDVFARIRTQGKITGDEIMRLGLVGVNAFEILGDAAGVSAEEMRVQVTAGAVDAETAIAALTAGMKERFGGAAEGVKETWLGATDAVKASARDLGSALVEAFISKEGGGAAIDFANDFADLTRDLIPVAEAFGRVLVAAFNTVGVAIKIVLPVLTAFGEGLAAIPSWAFAAAVGVAALVVAMKNAFAIGKFLGASFAALTNPLTLALVAVGAAVTLFGIFTRESRDAAAAEEEFAEAAEGTADELFGLADAESAAADATGDHALKIADAESELAQFLSTSDSSLFSTQDLTGAVADLGITFDDLADFLVDGQEGLTDFIELFADVEGIDLEAMGTSVGEVAAALDDMAAAGVDVRSLLDEIDRAVDTFGRTGGAANAASQAIIDLAADNEDFRKTLGAFVDQQRLLEAAAEAAKENQLAVGLVTEAQLAFAESTLVARGESSSLSDQLLFVAQNLDFVISAAGDATDKQLEMLGRFDEMEVQVLSTTGAWEMLAKAIAAGTIAEEDFDRVAASFGVTRDTIVEFAKESSAALEEFTSSATSQLPQAVDAIELVEDAVDPTVFAANLKAQIEAMQGWRFRVELLARAGFEGLARLAFEAGPQQGGALAKGLIEAQPEVRAGAEWMLGGARQVYEDTNVWAREDFGPRFAFTGGEIARMMNEQFGLTLTPATTAREALNAVIAVFGEGSEETKNAGIFLGLSTTAGVETGIAGLPAPVDRAIDLATGAIRGGEGALFSAAEKAGRAGAATGMAEGTEPIPGETGAVFEEGADAILNAQAPLLVTARAVGTTIGAAFGVAIADTIGRTASQIRGATIGVIVAASSLTIFAYNQGTFVGASFSAGVADGIGINTALVESAARAVVIAAENAARAIAGAFSPSRLFADLGEDLGAGLEQGLDRRGADVVAAAERIVSDAAAARFGIAAGHTVSTTVPHGGAGGFAFGPITVQVNVDGTLDERQARKVGVAVADGIFAEAALQRRRVVVDARTT